MGKSLLDALQESYGKMTKKQMFLARYLVENYKQAAFMNSKEMARAAEVSESTVLRLASTMNYSRFADFQSALQGLVRSRMSSLEKFESSEKARKKLLSYVVSLESSIMSEMANNMNEKAFEEAISLLGEVGKVFVVGLGADAVYAGYFYRFLNILRNNVILLPPGSDPQVFSTVMEDNVDSSVAVVYHFPRYYRRTVELCKILASRKVRMIGITDNVLAPLASIAAPLLLVPTRYITAIDPGGAIMALNHAMLTGMIKRSPEIYKKRLLDFYDFSKSQDRCIREDVDVPFHLEEIE
ncbi:MAG: MurR/RpiR family transcriptional regulator [Synergistales bacterium]|jgi:DNA-binding MurR/RpiR family transcriptional regulator